MRLIQPAVEDFHGETDSNKDTYTEKFIGAKSMQLDWKLKHIKQQSEDNNCIKNVAKPKEIIG